MTLAEKSARITVDLGERQLLRRLKVAAADNDLSIRDIVIEAVSFWLEHQELVEDTLAEEKARRVVAESQGDYVLHADLKRSTGKGRP